MSERQIQAVMFDSGRLIEKHDFYFDIIPYLAEWGYNTILWHFTDNETCAIRFDCAPELADKNAFSKKEMAKLITHAWKYGIEIIPELETFGHTGYILRQAEYAHLLELQQGPYHFVICPSSCQTLTLMEKLIKETAEIFPSKFLHVGFDEADFGFCPLCCLKITKSGSRSDVFSGYLEKIKNIAMKYGKETMIWGDLLLKHREMVEKISKDIIICDWHYNDVDQETVEFFIDKGFKVICAPSANAGKVICPAKSNLENIRSFSRVANQLAGKGVIGSINTVWHPWRSLQGSMLHAIALGGELIRNPESSEDEFNKNFAEKYFGIPEAQEVASCLQDLLAAVPEFMLAIKLTPDSWDNFQLLSTEELAMCQKMKNLAIRIATILKEYASQVTSHNDYYAEITLNAEIIATLAFDAESINLLFQYFSQNKSSASLPDNISQICDKLSSRRFSLFEQTVKCWNVNRFQDDPLRDAETFRYQKVDSLMFRLKGSAEFFKDLTAGLK